MLLAVNILLKALRKQIKFVYHKALQICLIMSFMQQSIGFMYTIGLMIYEIASSTCFIQVRGIIVLIRIIAIQLINAYQAGNS